MKKRMRLRHPVLQALEIPSELIYSEPVLTMTGGSSVSIENYKCILKYTCEEIWLKTSAGVLKICGCGLYIPFYTADEMKVEGRISAILIESR